ncbi:meprin A subunit beta-like isoform X2 [Alosa sapidissima]|uniref:meprin A subunit beta-like isoform X2 n=1 Tax=Alosa sapidissima TaxID=34773 RepID=UPI001C094E6B|nr:meprin A subunit beta-like isoform X2 [Alosa sapidissima]
MRAIGLYFMAVVFSLMASIERTLTLPVLVGGIYSVMKNNTGLIDINKGLDLFEGDIKLPPKYDKSGVIDPGYRWTIPVPLEFDSSLDLNARGVITKALEQFRLKTCIDFKIRDTEMHYVKIVKDNGCYGYVGNYYMAGQPLSIGDGCDSIAIVEHEMLHTLGFWHEQSRPDRDDHISILWNNIEEGKENNFEIKEYAEATTQGTAYDYKSLMHYDKDSFSNGWGDTIYTKKQEFQNIIGQRQDFSPTDVLELNLLYGCSTSSTVTFLDGCNFEEDMCDMRACSTAESRWKAVSSIVGGPTEDHSIPQDQGGKGHFMHFSTVSGMTGDRGLLKTKIMTPQRDFQCLEFFYYSKGNDKDQLNIWIREFQSVDDVGATRLIGQITGSTADYWQLQHIQLYTTKAFLIEFESVKGEGMSSGGFSLDDINLSETTCPHSVWHIRNFAEHLQQSGVFSFSPRLYSTEGYSYQVLVSYGPEALGVFFWLVSGVYDNSLQWPCPSRQITIELLEQTSSILKRMSKQISVTLDTTETFTINGQTFYKWDNPLIFGKQYEDSEGWYYAGPLIGDGNFISKERIMAGDFIRGGDAFLLISFEDVLAQPSPILPTPMSVTYDSFTPSPADNLSPCVYYECDFVSVNRTAVCIPSHFIAFLAFIVTVILSIH